MTNLRNIARCALGLITAGAIVLGVALATRADAGPPGRRASAGDTALVNPAATCPGVSRDPADHLRVVGRRLEDTQGHVIVPEGISIVGGPEQPSYVAASRSTYAQIDAAADAWHVNSQRLQVSETNLVDRPTPGHGYNVAFASYLNGMICRILDDHEIAIVNDNTWFTGDAPDPTGATVRFWDYMSLNYRNLPVIFDLFNEPRLKQQKDGKTLTDGQVWHLWKWGGAVSGVSYVGMQPLVNAIRHNAQNVIWVESAYETSHTYALGAHLLSGGNLMYSFHKLRLDDSQAWYAVGKLAEQGVALVDGEWSEFAALHRPWECYSDAYTAAPAYLKYWKDEGVGFEAWSLQYGALVRGRYPRGVHDGNFTGLPTDPRALEVPNAISRAYGCNAASLGQGAGTLVMQYFAANTVPAPRALFTSSQ